MKDRQRRWQGRGISFLIGILLMLFPFHALAQQPFDLSQLGQNLGKTLADLQVKTVAIAEFASIDGAPSALGKLIAEEVTTGLFRQPNIKVIERSMLDRILTEQKFQLSGLTDQSIVQKIGQLLGADAVIIGTWADMADKIRINARIVAVSTGNVVSAAAASIERTEGIKRIQASGTDRPSSAAAASPEGPVTRETAGKAGAVFFREDFSNIELGNDPPGWGGTDSMMVAEHGDKRKTKVLKPFKPGPAVLRVPGVKFPENFRFRWVVSQGGGDRYPYQQAFVQIGNISAGLYYSHSGHGAYLLSINESVIGGSRLSATTREYVLEKKGSVFRLLVDGSQVLLARYPAFKVDSGFILSLTFKDERATCNVILHLIEGIDLGS